MGIKGIDNLAQDIVEYYSAGMDSLTESVLAAAKECATECCENIREDSPADSGVYRSGWVCRKTKDGYVVYNKNKPQLEMILENGRTITRGEHKGQRVAGTPHIYRNAEDAREKFYDKCVDIASGGVRLKFKRR